MIASKELRESRELFLSVPNPVIDDGGWAFMLTSWLRRRRQYSRERLAEAFKEDLTQPTQLSEEIVPVFYIQDLLS